MAAALEFPTYVEGFSVSLWFENIIHSPKSKRLWIIFKKASSRSWKQGSWKAEDRYVEGQAVSCRVCGTPRSVFVTQ